MKSIFVLLMLQIEAYSIQLRYGHSHDAAEGVSFIFS